MSKMVSPYLQYFPGAGKQRSAPNKDAQWGVSQRTIGRASEHVKAIDLWFQSHSCPRQVLLAGSVGMSPSEQLVVWSFTNIWGRIERKPDFGLTGRRTEARFSHLIGSFGVFQYVPLPPA